MRSNLLAMSIALLLIWNSCPAKCEIVFDNITGATQFGSGGIVTGAGGQGGGIVNLAGTSRDVTKLDVALYEFSGGGVPGDLTFRVNLWSPSGIPDNPGSLLWSSTIQHASLLNRTATPFSVAVPTLHVPDRLGWTVEGISNLHSAGVVNASPATVGTIVGQMLYGPPWNVITFSPTLSGLGFRLFAVPEPAASIFFIGLVAAMLQIRPSRRTR